MARYDEDLHENAFFQTLTGKHANLFNEAAENKWLICVPRYDTVFRLKLNRTDFENHILRPHNTHQNSNEFLSLNSKHAFIDGGTVKAGHGFKEARSVKILFDECFFNSREESYQVFCLEQPLEGAMGEDIMVSLKNLEDCKKFLWGEQGAEKVRRSIDRLVEMFHVSKGTSMRPIIDAVLALYTRAIQETFKLRKFQAVMQKNFCKLAMETYVMAGLHKKIFKEVCFFFAPKDAAFNKITRNLSDINPQSLSIKPQFRLVLNKARQVLSQLNQFTTPLEKLYCFSHTVSILTDAHSMAASQEVVTADELLPTLVYLVIVTDIPNWTGNLSYINRFHFSGVTSEEFSYYLTSFEAAVEYVRSDHLELNNKATPSLFPTSIKTMERIRSNSSSMDEETTRFFNLVSNGDLKGVKALLEAALEEKASLQSRLCHPLCDCPRCSALLEKQLDDSDRASVFLRDEDGRTGLHYAALIGHNELVQLLIEHGAIVMATDHNSSTPLHLSCFKGHQKCTLLLLGEGSIINAIDNHGNTPLHQACSNGHEECVKALLFHTSRCEVNVHNEQGDTPLHYAARWGYASIVSELLGMGANPTLQNRRREIPQQCAQNRRVQELLHTACVKRSEGETVAVSEGPALSRDSSPPVIIRNNKKLSKRQTVRDSMSSEDRQIKKLFRAIHDGDTNLVQYLLGWDQKASAKVSPEDLCHPLCQCDRCSKLRRTMAGETLSVNCSDSSGHTPLHEACLVGQREMVELFLRHGAQLEIIAPENDQSPLHVACQYNHKDVVCVLLEAGAQIDPTDGQGNTPLHLACSNGHMETATLLLMNGADVTISNNRGNTPLHNAARWNHPSLVNELLLYGANYTATNIDNKVPADLTGDDEVRETIWKAARGIIDVGSYSPLNVHRRLGQRSKVKDQSSIAIVQQQQQEVISGDVSCESGSKSSEETWCILDSTEGRSREVSPVRAGEHKTLGPQAVTEGQSSAESGAAAAAAAAEVAPSKLQKPRPQRDEKLIGLLQAIEAFDRSTLHKSDIDDRSAPSLRPSDIPPNSLCQEMFPKERLDIDGSTPSLCPSDTPPSIHDSLHPQDTPPPLDMSSCHSPDMPPGSSDKDSPLLNRPHPPATPPYSPHHYHLCNEEMQTVGSGGWSQ